MRLLIFLLLGFPNRLLFVNLFGGVPKFGKIRLGLSNAIAFIFRLKACFKFFPRGRHALLLLLFVGISLGLFEGIWQPWPLIDYLQDCIQGKEEFRLF